MHRIVTGSFPDFADAARGVSALMAAGLSIGEVSIIAIPPPDRDPPPTRPPDGYVRAGASMMGALGAILGPGTGWAWAPPDPGALLVFAPVAGALAGACLGAIAGLLVDHFARNAAAAARRPIVHGRLDAESVTVVVDEALAGRVEAILRQHGAALAPHDRGRVRTPSPVAPPLLLAPHRP